VHFRVGRQGFMCKENAVARHLGTQGETKKIAWYY
jgi:hypothetical protein